MSRVSAFRGTWEENKRPHIVLAPDAYVALQGQTTVTTCGECGRKTNINKYITGISTEASVDSPPGSATVNLSIPDTDINDLSVEGNLVIIPMMEIEIFSKGYYTVGGLPQYYRIFWGVITNVSKNWSNGVTSVTLTCKDILYWWEKTNVILNPAFVGNEGASCGYQLFGNQFAGLNPYTIIIALAKEAMGDFSITDGSFMSYKPEAGPENQVIGQYAKDVMAYWQLKFGNIWNSLVLYGASGTAYTFEGAGMDISPIRFSNSIFKHEADMLPQNKLTAEFKIQPGEVAAFKVNIQETGDVQFFQNNTQSKLSVALTARDQILYEFYCDTTGDIIFKPPFYNINVIPNKPVSWINDFEIIEDGINDSEQEVVTHMTSSGNAFGGVTDYGLTDEITVPRTGVIDWHLLKRYGWRRHDFQCEWAGNPKKLFWFLVDYMDRINAKRQSGTVTIPLRPEIRMGFPVWIPHYDSFFYVNAVSHNYSPGGTATTTLTLVAKRSKFIAPKNLGRVERVPVKASTQPAVNSVSNKKNPSASPQKNNQERKDLEMDHGVARRRELFSYKVSFDGAIGQTAGLNAENQQTPNEPLIIRDPNTGKLLGYPNVVMVYRTTFAGEPIAKMASEQGNVGGKGGKKNDQQRPPQYKYDDVVRKLFTQLRDSNKATVINRLRMNRYEAGMTNSGLYDYAVDVAGDFKEMILIPITSITWGTGTDDPSKVSGAATSPPDTTVKGKGKNPAPGGKKGTPAPSPQDEFMGCSSAAEFNKKRNEDLQNQIDECNTILYGDNKQKSKNGQKADKGIYGQFVEVNKSLSAARAAFLKGVSSHNKNKKVPAAGAPPTYTAEDDKNKALVDSLQAESDSLKRQVDEWKTKLEDLTRAKSDFRIAEHLNVSVRPVSDEFGFEVIGHNRYGRGVFVDRGQMRLKMEGASQQGTPGPNELRIQFSPTGGMLTEVPSSLAMTLKADTAPEAFEKMQPEDWVTGASNHTNGDVTLTSASTFSSAINHEIEANAQVGAVFIEADATRRSKTIWEMQPTMVTGLDSVGFASCNCALSKFQWYSVLPKNVLQEILQPSIASIKTTDVYVFKRQVYINAYSGEETTEAVSEKSVLSWDGGKSQRIDLKQNNRIRADFVKKDPKTGDEQVIRREYNTDGEVPVSIEVSVDGPNANRSATVTKPDFFTQLNEYLVKRFEESYKYNEEREVQDVGEDLGVEVLETGPEDYVDPDSVLGSTGGSLFDRAALGDVDALQALQNQVSWDWSASEKALSDFNEAAEELKHWTPPETSLAESMPAPWIPGKAAPKVQIQPLTPSPVKIDTTPSKVFNSYPTNPFDPKASIVNDPDHVPVPTNPAPPKQS